jgi:hypothetical protein
MIHRILVGQRAGEMAKVVYLNGDSIFPPLSMEPAFVNTFRIFSKIEVVTADDQSRFDAMLRGLSPDYGNVEVKADIGAYLGFAGHPY